MQLTVRGKQFDVGDALRTHVEGSLEHILDKYFGDAIDVDVTFSREAHLVRAQITAHVGRGIQLQAQGDEERAHQAFDAASNRLSTRLRRYKRRLRSHHKEPDPEHLLAQHFILDSGPEQEEIEGGDQPIVIAEMETPVLSLTVSEAVMRMDLADLPALLFRNLSHNGLNMVYRRPDGNIGWIDPADGKGA